MHICVSKLIIIGSDNGLSPGWRQAIIWTNAGILLIGTLGTKFSETLIETHTFSFKKMHLQMSSGKWRPFCLGLNLLTHWGRDKIDAISQTTFSSAFSWMKMYEFRLIFHWNLFLRVPLTICKSPGCTKIIYRKICNISWNQITKLKWFSSRLAVVFVHNSIQARC